MKNFLFALKKFLSRELVRYKLIYSNKQPMLPMSAEAKRIYKDLKNEGICKIDDKYQAIADYLINEYEAMITKRNTADGRLLADISEAAELKGRTYNYLITLKDPKLNELFYNEDIFAAIYNLYRHQPYYRSYPTMECWEFKENMGQDISSTFHVDRGIFQISFMLLLNDLTLNDTHLEYAKKSNKNRFRIEKETFNEEKIRNTYEIVNGIGKKGTLYVFVPGTGIHKLCYKPNSVRKDLFINITVGDNIENLKFEKLEEYVSHQGFAPGVSRLVEKITL